MNGGGGVGGVILENISKFDLDKSTKSSPNSFRDIFTSCLLERSSSSSFTLDNNLELTFGLSTILDCSTLEMLA